MPGTAVIRNLRDLGGYLASDGRRLKPGLVFRSSAPGPDAADLLHDLGIAMVFDFRSGPERDHGPVLPDIVGLRRWQLPPDASLGDPRPLLARGLHSAVQTRAMMCEVYARLPDDHRNSYGALVKHLTADAAPLLFHCAAGKDRTGVAAALLLTLLGVPRAAVEADYLASNAVVSATTAAFVADPRHAAMLAGPSAVWRPMMLADAAFLDAMFAAVTARYGSVAGYAEAALQLSSSDLDRLRDRLLD